MRIALLSHSSSADSVGNDGLVVGLHAHARALVGLGHSVHVFATAAAAAGEIERDGFLQTFVGPGGALHRALTLPAGAGLSGVAAALRDAHDGFAALRPRFRAGEFDVVEVVGDAAAAGLVALCDGMPSLVRAIGSWPPEGSAVERFAAGRLLRLGLRAAHAVSVPSLWLRDHLHRCRLLERHALVVADGVELPARARELDPGALRVWFDADRRSADVVAGILADAREHLPQLRILVDGPSRSRSVREQLVERLAAIAEPFTADGAVALFVCERAPACPAPLLAALASGMPIVASARGCIPEVVRREVDALLFDAPSDARRPLERVLRTASLRERLATAARKRAAARFDPIATARRRLQIYEFASRGRIARSRSIAAPVVTLGPDNWFCAWWLSGSEHLATRLDRAALLGLPYEELKVVEAVLMRAWTEGPADWSAPEWVELDEFRTQVLERCDELRRRGVARDDRSTAELALPPLDHPMFGPDEDGILLAEIWRLEDHARLAEWFETAVSRRDFAGQATENVNLRRIAVEAARRRPGVAAFQALRRIYRDPKQRDRIVDSDLEFISRVHADAFARGIEQFGLHAPIAREKFPLPRKARRKVTASGTSPRITVLIPSFRHEAYIAQAIESCLRQSIDDLRVQVADDLSPDGTAAAAQAIDDPRLSVAVNSRNLGLGASVLCALDSIDTPFVALLNSDDLFHAQRLEKCLAVLEGDPEATLVATSFAVVDRNGNQLTHATSCAAEIGPQAYGWLRWFEAIEREELLRPEDWTSFEVLLRHNVLATSSNMVFRTDWLRAHMREASRLRYCLDWQLFLQASMEGTLRVVPERLLAYRLHDANTVWFREGGRADYVIEVNRVVDRVLVQWLERATARDGAAVAIERFAGILEQAVERHGETDGLALYLADLSRRIAESPVDSTATSVAALADAAVRRKIHAMVMRQVEVDPWSVPSRVRIAERWRIEHEVADGFSARARELDRDSAQLRVELDTRRKEVDDALARSQQTDELLVRQAAEAAETLRKLRSEYDAARVDLESRLLGAQHVATLLQGELDSERVERLAVEARLESTTEALAQVERRRAALALEVQRREDEIHRLGIVAADDRSQLEALRADLAESQRRLEVLRQDLVRLESALQSAREQRNAALHDAALRDRFGDRVMSALAAATGEREALIDDLVPQSGTPLFAAGLLAKVEKTLRGMTRRGAEAMRRARWHAVRAVSARARARRGVTIFDDGIADRGREARSVLEARPLADLGARIIGFARGCRRSTRRDVDQHLAAIGLGPAILIVDDGRLATIDRRYFERRVPAAVAFLDDLLGPANPWPDRALRAARLAKTRGSGLAVAHGLGPAALVALANQLLIGSRFIVLLADGDLAADTLSPKVQQAILERASALVVDGEELRTALLARLGQTPARILVRPAAAPSLQPGIATPAVVGFALAVTATTAASRAALVDGLLAAQLGVDTRLHLFPAGSDHAALTAQFDLLARLDVAGLSGHVLQHPTPAATLTAADTLVWLGEPPRGFGLPGPVGRALAAGRRLIATELACTRPLAGLGAAVTLLPAGDRAAIAAALTRAAARLPDPTSAFLERANRFTVARADADRAFTSTCQQLRESPSTRR